MSRSGPDGLVHDQMAMPSPAPNKTGNMVNIPGEVPSSHGLPSSGVAPVIPVPLNKNTDEYEPCFRPQSNYGPVDFGTSGDPNRGSLVSVATELEQLRPDMPQAADMGLIDIHALTMSIQSGIHSEVRMALDTLAIVTVSNQQNLDLDLRGCDELAETLIECAEDQIELLAEHTVEVCDEILINPYEDIVRACKTERLALRPVPAFGTTEYDLDRAVDRLICITTILRNLSFNERNQGLLAEETVVKFFCVVIRYLGTRNMLLRTHSNTLDFMKDLIIVLSNIAGAIELPGKEQALCLLQFLLAFAPTPSPSVSQDQLWFSAYEPVLQPYLPPAVDALAKLLARDEPNRTHYKAIFAADAAGSPACELLTRAFGLAISPIPDQTRDGRSTSLPSVVEVRKPFLMQGLLAADIIASLAPGYESGVTRAWLSSGSGFAQNLFRLIRLLSLQFEGSPPPRPGGPQPRGHGHGHPAVARRDGELVYIVVIGVSMLRRLSEKARDPGDPVGSLPPNATPSRETVLGALAMSAAEWTKEGMLSSLLAYASLED